MERSDVAVVFCCCHQLLAFSQRCYEPYESTLSHTLGEEKTLKLIITHVFCHCVITGYARLLFGDVQFTVFVVRLHHARNLLNICMYARLNDDVP